MPAVFKSALYGTDIGPPCWRCSETLWTYEPMGPFRGYWKAVCATCHAADGPLCLPDDGADRASALRERHNEYVEHVRPHMVAWTILVTDVHGHTATLADRFPTRDHACRWASRELGLGKWTAIQVPA